MENTLTAWDVYWITRCDGIVTLSVIAAIFFGLLMVFGPIAFIGSIDLADICGPKRSAVLLRRCAAGIFSAFALSLLLAVFVPTTKQAAAMIVLPAVANSEDVRGLGSEVIDAARAWLRETADVEEGQGN